MHIQRRADGLAQKRRADPSLAHSLTHVHSLTRPRTLSHVQQPRQAAQRGAAPAPRPPSPRLRARMHMHGIDINRHADAAHPASFLSAVSSDGRGPPHNCHPAATSSALRTRCPAHLSPIPIHHVYMRRTISHQTQPDSASDRKQNRTEQR